MAHLHFLSGPLEGKRAHLKARQISLGRAPGNSIRVDDPSVAPRHLVLVREDDEYALFIDASKPPVAINGKQVVNETLKDGDRVQIGAILARFSNKARRPAPTQPAPNPLDFWAEQPTAKPKSEPEILSLDDAEELPLEDDAPRRPNRAMRALLALGLLMLMLGGSLLLFRKDVWKEPTKPIDVAEEKKEESKPVPDNPEPPPGPMIDVPAGPQTPLEPLGIGAGAAGARADAKVLRTKNFKSHQEAVDAAAPGDSVIFDTPDTQPIVVVKPLRDVQFLSGAASWELHADLVDCQFLFHETKQMIQRGGRLERCAFYRCPMKQTRLVHADAVSFYFDERSPLRPKDNPDNGKTPILDLTGFVRNVLIMKPFADTVAADKKFDLHWGPSIRIHATHPEGDGRGTYILSPVVRGQRAWTPHLISRGNGITYAHLTADNCAWADPVLEVLRGHDCIVLCTSFSGETATTAEQYAAPPKKLKYHDHEEYGHDNGPAFRGQALTLMGLRNRIVAHGDARKTWTVGRKSGLPGLHYADGIVAVDPAIKQFATEHGGLSVNFAEQKSTFVMGPAKAGAEFMSQPQQADGAALYPKEGPELHRPYFVPLKDLRVDAGEFDNLQLTDMTGKKGAEIEKALAGKKSIYLGPGTYEFKQTVKEGFLVGAGMDKTILKWPDGVDCCQRPCRGMINCTLSGGRFGYNSQSGAGGRPANPEGLFLRTRFTGQKEAGVNLHASLFQTWQDCEFTSGKAGFAHGLDKGSGVFKGDKGTAGGVTIDNLNICNCTFRAIRQRAIDITPDSPQLGHVGVHNCLFDNIGDSAIRIAGGQTHLVQLCQLRYCGHQSYAPALSIVSNGALAVSHVDIDCTGVKGNPICASLKGLAAMSHCSLRGMTTSLTCDGLLAADHIVGDGKLQTTKGSLLCQCRFTNMDLENGTAVANDKGFANVTAKTLPALVDNAPPPEVGGQKVRTVNGQRRIDWSPAASPETGIAYYLILSDEKEVSRVSFQYEPPSDFHSPLLKLPPPTSFIDPNLMNRNYDVVAVNGAGLTADGIEPPPRRVGPARARFFSKEGDLLVIKDFAPLAKGKALEIIAEDGKRYPYAKLGNNGAPNVVYFELGEIIEGP
jgi:hypothetical protein